MPAPRKRLVPRRYPAWRLSMLFRDDDWVDRMPWVPPMPGNKTYVLQEAQKEIERLRQEIKRLRRDNKELCTGMALLMPRPGSEKEQKQSTHPGRHCDPNQANDENLYITGVVKVL